MTLKVVQQDILASNLRGILKRVYNVVVILYLDVLHVMDSQMLQMILLNLLQSRPNARCKKASSKKFTRRRHDRI